MNNQYLFCLINKIFKRLDLNPSFQTAGFLIGNVFRFFSYKIERDGLKIALLFLVKILDLFSISSF